MLPQSRRPAETSGSNATPQVFRDTNIEGLTTTTAARLDRCLEAAEQIDRNANQTTLIETWLDDLAGI